MLIQSSHSHVDRGLDPYFTPPEATIALCNIEHLPERIWEPACGNGAIAEVLKQFGHTVHSSDIADYGYGVHPVDYLKTAPAPAICPDAIVTNPPYKLAVEFATKALSEAPYLALLLRTNFLESTSRLPFFRAHPPSRVWISSRRLPMMHRLGWDGPEAPSNTCHAWFIWDVVAQVRQHVDWFDWQDYGATAATAATAVDPKSLGF